MNQINHLKKFQVGSHTETNEKGINLEPPEK